MKHLLCTCLLAAAAVLTSLSAKAQLFDNGLI